MEEKKEDCPLCNVSEDTIKNLENADSSKKEKYFLKKEKKEQEQSLKIHRKKTGKIIKTSIISLIVLLIIGGVALGINKSLKNRNLGDPKVEVANLEYDAGTVFMADGLVRHTYEIKNTGVGDLKIKNISTSCMCTTARFRDGNKIAPGETGYLEVIFDQNFHGPAGIGSVTRGVYLTTNDPDNKTIELILIAEVKK
ncbi:DUF1573 domain-containing protein [Patescibacteria group bacterium]|nr:DUF1573 domain-containing protein [Patescibacteria group bacterium]